MIGRGFSSHVSRSQMSGMQFTDCFRCQDTVFKARVTKTQRDQLFDPQPTGGTDIDPVYSIHECKTAR